MARGYAKSPFLAVAGGEPVGPRFSPSAGHALRSLSRVSLRLHSFYALPDPSPASDDVSNTPGFGETHFTCPSCRQPADQVWLNVYAAPISNPAGTPLRIAGADLERLRQNPQFPPEVRDMKVAYWNRVNSGAVFLDRWAPVQTDLFVAGMELSVCLGCRATAVWLGGQRVYP